jgi:urease accessory protein UreH
MVAYILRWRGEAEVVARYLGLKKSEHAACGCLVLKAMAATQERIRKLSRTYHEQITNRIDFALKLTVY